MKYAICNINIEIPVADDLTDNEILNLVENYELPKEYVSDSFEFIKVIKEIK